MSTAPPVPSMPSPVAPQASYAWSAASPAPSMTVARPSTVPAVPTRAAEVLTLTLQIHDGSGAERRTEVHVSRECTIAELKRQHFTDELSRGCRLRCIFLGRHLADEELVAQMPSGSVLQCFLHKAPTIARDHPFGARVRVSLTTGGTVGTGYPDPTLRHSKWQDLVFHSIFAVGLAAAWGIFFSDHLSFDSFGRFALRFFSLAWVAVCSADLLSVARPPGDGAAVVTHLREGQFVVALLRRELPLNTPLAEPSAPQAGGAPQPLDRRAAAVPEPSAPRTAAAPEPPGPRAAAAPEPSAPEAGAVSEPSAAQAAAALESSAPQAGAVSEPSAAQAAAALESSAPQAGAVSEPSAPRAAAAPEPSAPQASAAAEPLDARQAARPALLRAAAALEPSGDLKLLAPQVLEPLDGHESSVAEAAFAPEPSGAPKLSASQATLPEPSDGCQPSSLQAAAAAALV
eukprot:gnl/TRDRNA2_/TRDRNA2_138056_c0_seq1.p1 gnl/TRDRNA2_/TRDRNA2_138056_c0~~gnl/TRDRNA2_/TRDRNA2_138056_c0_seq1.p1  ORF type:complete len:470 (+),score=76.20 gnl/TRDRNA2_/TRDRNA2_138056_c0_seq1:34-1410(+)